MNYKALSIYLLYDYLGKKFANPWYNKAEMIISMYFSEGPERK